MPRSLAICMPIYRTVEAETALCLARLARHEAARGTHLEIFGSIGSMVAWSRGDLARAAVAAGCEWTLWLDSDMTFPEDTAEHLLASDLPFVVANCVFRDGTRFTAEKWGKTVETTRESKGRVSVDLVGLAVALVKTELFEKLTPPHFDVIDTGGTRLGEDHYFCQRVRDELGIRPHIDHELSKLVTHLGTVRMGVA